MLIDRCLEAGDEIEHNKDGLWYAGARDSTYRSIDCSEQTCDSSAVSPRQHAQSVQSHV